MALLKILASFSLTPALATLGTAAAFGSPVTTIAVLLFVAFCICWSAMEIARRLDAWPDYPAGQSPANGPGPGGSGLYFCSRRSNDQTTPTTGIAPADPTGAPQPKREVEINGNGE